MNDNELNKLLCELKKLDSRPLKPSNSNENISKNSFDDLLNLTTIANFDKDLTLGEYLEKHSQFTSIIEEEEKKVNSSRSHSFEELLKILEGESEDFIEKKIDEDFEYRAVKTLFAKNAKSVEEVRTRDIFLNQSKQRCNNVVVRIKPYSNTKALVIKEEKMSPLKLKKYNS
jgi:hypothetical protein